MRKLDLQTCVCEIEERLSGGFRFVEPRPKVLVPSVILARIRQESSGHSNTKVREERDGQRNTEASEVQNLVGFAGEVAAFKIFFGHLYGVNAPNIAPLLVGTFAPDLGRVDCKSASLRFIRRGWTYQKTTKRSPDLSGEIPIALLAVRESVDGHWCELLGIVSWEFAWTEGSEMEKESLRRTKRALYLSALEKTETALLEWKPHLIGWQDCFA